MILWTKIEVLHPLGVTTPKARSGYSLQVLTQGGFDFAQPPSQFGTSFACSRFRGRSEVEAPENKKPYRLVS
jgi:hypothetical protein